MQLQDKVAVITGGNSGIGLASAQTLADLGAKVVISGRDEEALARSVEQISGETLAVRADVDQIRRFGRSLRTNGTYLRQGRYPLY